MELVHFYILIFLGICHDGFTEYKGRCYRYYNSSNSREYISTWNHAKYACKNLNEGKFLYDLVSVHDYYENKFLVSLMLQEDPYLGSKHYNFPWIGLYCPPAFHNKFYLTCSNHATTQGSWKNAKWTDGSSVNFTNWSKEPKEQAIPSQKKVFF